MVVVVVVVVVVVDVADGVVVDGVAVVVEGEATAGTAAGAVDVGVSGTVEALIVNYDVMEDDPDVKVDE